MSVKYLENYRLINERLIVCIDYYLSIVENKKIHSLFVDSKNRCERNYKNRLIATSTKKNIGQEYRSLLLGVNWNRKIGTVGIEEQFDGITAMTILMLLTNRVAKEYQFQIENNPELLSYKKEFYRKRIESMYYWKNEAVSELLASIYVLKETIHENQTNIDYTDFFSYGHGIDTEINPLAKDVLVIDLPYYGQIGIHFGNEQTMERDIRRAKGKAKAILKTKELLGQISEQETREIIQKIDDDTIFPKYTGIFYEYNSTLPTNYISSKIKRIRDNELKGKVPEDITVADIKSLYYNCNLNSREIRYLAIKLGFTKTQLDWLDEIIKKEEQRNELDIRELGKKAIEATNAEERRRINFEEEIVIKGNDESMQNRY